MYTGCLYALPIRSLYAVMLLGSTAVPQGLHAPESILTEDYWVRMRLLHFLVSVEESVFLRGPTIVTGDWERYRTSSELNTIPLFYLSRTG